MKQFQYRIISTFSGGAKVPVGGPWKDWFVGKGVDSQWQGKIVSNDPDWKDANTLWEMRSVELETA